jgi:parvulin-like peptidyl-prolyl isomerase
MGAGKDLELDHGYRLQGRWIRWGLVWIPAIVLFITACRGQEPAPRPEPPIAMVNGEPVSREEFESRVAEGIALAKGESPLKADQIASLKEEVLGRLIEERLILQRARELSLTVSDDEVEERVAEIKKDYRNEGFDSQFGEGRINYQAWRKDLQKRILLEKVIVQDVNANVQVTDSEAELYFKANRRAYLSEKKVRAVQIVVRDKDLADVTLKRLKAGEDFDKVAREASIGPEAERGGDLGFFERGMMPEAIDRVVFSLPVGKISGVVKSPYGYHIFKVLDAQEASGRKFAEVKERVSADLRKIKEAESYERWIEEITTKASIQIHRPLPEVQAQMQAEGMLKNAPSEPKKH